MMTTESAKSKLLVLALLSFGVILLLFCTHKSVAAQSQADDGGYILVRVNCFEIRALPVDLADGDVAELQLMVIVTDGEQVNGTFTFFQDSSNPETRSVRAGQRFCDTDANGPWFAVDQALDQVAVWFVAVDSDDLNLLESAEADVASIAPIELLARGLKALVGDSGVLSILSRSNLVTGVLDFAFNRALEVWELPDTIGEYQTVLWRQQAWNLGSYTANSADGNISIDYEVLMTSENPENSLGDSALQGGTDPQAVHPTPISTSVAVVEVRANQETGTSFICPTSGTYQIVLQEGAYSPWANGTGGQWRTLLFAYVDHEIVWERDQYGFVVPSPFGIPSHDSAAVGSLELRNDDTMSSAERRGSGDMDQLYCENGQIIYFVAIDERGAYADNFGSVTIEIYLGEA